MTVLRRIAGQAREPALLIGRLLLAWIFLHEGLTLAAGLDGAVAALGRLGVPAALAVTTIALQVMAGAALGIGLGTRIAAVALGLFCVGTATLFHANFAVRNELLHFEKDLAIAGGLFVLAASGAGAWSADHIATKWLPSWRTRRAVGAPAH